MTERKGHLVLDEQNESIELPVLSGTMGPDVVDIRSLNQHRLFTFDPGFLSTASTESKITFIDGEHGVLLYRGYPIQQLAEHSDFLEVGYLLMYGELPDAAQKAAYEANIRRHNLIHDQMTVFFRGFRRDAHPMAILVGVVGALSAFYHDSFDVSDLEHRELAAYRLIAKMPALIAMSYKYSIGHPFQFPRNNLGYVANFLHMMFATPREEYIPDPVLVQALEKIFILHADHEQNASTSTVRLVGSSGANPFACIAAGIASLWGPAHGGANEAVLVMLNEIGDVANIPQFVERAKNRQDPFRLMGFGHRVYRNYDPRANVLRETCHQVLGQLGIKNNKLLDIAMALEKVALEDEFFIERKLYPNVDFYSGILLHAIGIPTTMFTAIFALARTVGWVAQWNEMMSDPGRKIGRPRQLYTGPLERDFIPMDRRTG